MVRELGCVYSHQSLVRPSWGALIPQHSWPAAQLEKGALGATERLQAEDTGLASGSQAGVPWSGKDKEVPRDADISAMVGIGGADGHARQVK